jgi:hypothetical protein
VKSLIVTLILGSVILSLPAQEEKCRLLDAESGRKYLPDRAPLESESIPIDNKVISVLQFPDKSRTALALLAVSGLSGEMRKKYQYVLVSEAKLKLGRWNLPAGMIGLGVDSAGSDAPSRILVARDFIGTEIERITLALDPQAQDVPIALVPTGPREFEFRIGKYMIRGSQR